MTTEESPAPEARARAPLGLLGTVAIVLAAESYIAARNVDLVTMYTIEWRLTAKALKKEAPKAEVLCFGTSLSRIAISPLVLEARTGRPTYNLALSGSQPYASYLMLRHALDAGAKPRAILVDFKWTSIRNKPEESAGILPQIASLGECARLALDLRDGDFLGRVALVKELPSYACREEIRKNIEAAFKGEEPARNFQWVTAYKNSRINKGAHHTPVIPYKGEFDASDTDRFFPPDWACHPVSETYIHKFLDLAASRDIPVFIVIPPIAPGAQAWLDKIGAGARYTAFLRGVLDRHPGAVALDARRSGFPVGAFIDSSHVNRVGTADFSNAVADALEARLGGTPPADRWVALRPFAGGEGSEKIEDYMKTYENLILAQKAKDEASRLAGAARGETRR